MISLKLQPEESNETALGMSDAPSYGYGTCISLDEEQVKALGLDKMTIGTKVKVVAFGVIDSARLDVGEDEKAPNMSIQLTDMEVSGASSVDADKMYSTMLG